ncbi:MAG: diaminopimelate decarboxylase [Chloroflexota bacterium]
MNQTSEPEIGDRLKHMSKSRLPLFPLTTRIVSQSKQDTQERLTIADCDLQKLADHYGTPLYVYDRVTMDNAVEQYRNALQQHYPGETYITYAGKAWLCTAAAQWAMHQQLWIDCTGQGELYIAEKAGVPRSQILMHGVNKSFVDMRAGIHDAAVIVADNLTEVEKLVKWREGLLSVKIKRFPSIWLRVRPGMAVDTHQYTQTGQSDSKFGMDQDEILEAVRLCKGVLSLTGLHFHQGSHFHDLSPLESAIRFVLDLMVELRTQARWVPSALSAGGGWGVAYHEDELPHPDIEQYVSLIASSLVDGCEKHTLPLPTLYVEPGRSIVARAGVALYRVGAVKETENRRWLLLDGGMADNIRPALYGANYSALPVLSPNRANRYETWLGGPFCESGDVLIEGVSLPDIGKGEILAIPVSGAYQLSMGSNYNGALRPAVVWLENGKHTVIQRREMLHELIERDSTLSFD